MKKVFIVLIIFILKINSVHAAIKVVPTLIELSTNNAKSNYLTTKFSVCADKNETVRFKLYPQYFTISNNGKMNVSDSDNYPDSLVKYARFTPSEFTLKNGISQLVRITFADIDKLPDGESRMVMFIEDVKAREINLPNNNKNVSSKIIVKTRLGIPIYVDKGKFVKVCNFDDLKIECDNKNLAYKMHLSSSGNSKVRYRAKGQLIKDKELIEEFDMDSNTIRANGFFEERKYLPSNLKEGDYTFRVILTYKNEKGENKSLIKEANFSVANSI